MGINTGVATTGMPRLDSATRHLFLRMVPVGLGLICLYLVARHLDDLSFRHVLHDLEAVTPGQWLGAAIATGLSFWALARYDVLAHRHLCTGVPPARAAASGACAVALGQTLGFGLLTGALARWRALEEISLARATMVTGVVTALFLGTWAVLTALVCLVLPIPGLPLWPPLLILAAATGYASLSFLRPRLRIATRHLDLPSLRTIAAGLVFCAIDTAAAALAFWLLLPIGLAPDFWAFYPVFLVALGVGLFLGTPGGVGPFELSLLTFLPNTAQTQLVAAVLAFRILYYAAPAGLAAYYLLRPSRLPRDRAPQSAGRLLRPGARLAGVSAAPAGLGVLRQNGGAILSNAAGLWGVAATGQTITALGDPISGTTAGLAPSLKELARIRNRTACAYGISARSAAGLRRAGWAVAHVSDEAWIDTATHDLSGPGHRQLRRKLRHVERAGLRISAPKTALPFGAMADVDAAWAARHGPARGFSMGRFSAAYLAHQRVFLAWHSSRLDAFVSFHVGAQDWALDLMRARPGSADGVMHTLTQTAIETAALNGVARVSLAAVPARPSTPTPAPTISGPHGWLRQQMFQRGHGPGLAQFKSCFAPHWRPLYVAAPTAPLLALACADLALTIHRCDQRQFPLLPPSLPQQTHNEHEDIGIVSPRLS